MPNFQYSETDYSGTDKWIDKLEHITPASSADPNCEDIHFTKPKEVFASTVTHPHVTFVQSGRPHDHWFLKNEQGNWVFDSKGKAGPDLQKRQEIAGKILVDALALNWIRTAPPSKIISDDGFETVESKKGKKWRMQTGF